MRSLGFLCCLALFGCNSSNGLPVSVTDSAADQDRPGKDWPSSPVVADATSDQERPGSDWPGFLGPLGTSVSTEKGITAPWPAKGLPVLWKIDTGSGYAPPSVSRGRVFLFDRIEDSARLRCLKSSTGEELWKFEYPSKYEDDFGYEGGPRCCPVIDDDRVYIYGAEGMLHCVRFEDGKLLWKANTLKRFDVRKNFFGVGSTPIVEGDLLLVQVGGSPEGSENVDFADLKPDNSALVAFDKKTGEVKYKVGAELASYASPVLATIGERRWCLLFARGGLLGLEPRTGKVDFHFRWRARDLASVNASNPVVVGDRVLITECYGPGSALLKVKPGGYEKVWDDADKGRDKSLQCHWNTPIHHDGYVYGSSGRHTAGAELRCVELTTGKVMWRERGLDRASLLMVDGHFVCLSEYGNLRLLKVNPQKYEEVSHLELGDPRRPRAGLLEYPCWAAPVLSHGRLYLRGKGRLVCLDLIPAKKGS
jgi:outer membrane protein assembly factor BamB